MSSILNAAKAFFETIKDASWDDIKATLKQLPEDVQAAYWKMQKDSYFIPENEEVSQRKEILSPSGKYKLALYYFTTGKGSWSYSQGKVFSVGSDNPMTTVNRNYCSFPYSWIENHPNGHDYLICGEDYQGQTVIELDTGTRKDYLPEDAKKGAGFCWVDHQFDVASQILVVDGCVWAGPYEYRFYDFSDPMNGWPEIEPVDSYIEADERRPKIGSDGTIRCFDTSNYDDEEYDDDGNEIKKPEVVKSIKTFKRDGLKLNLIEEWVSEEEKKARREREEGRIAYEKKIADFKANDPLYLAYVELVKDPVLSPEKYESVGWTHDNWCPDWSGDERRWCRRIVDQKDRKKGYTVDLDWAMTSGPVKLTIYKDGNSFESKFFPHSVEGLKEAFEYAKELATKR